MRLRGGVSGNTLQYRFSVTTATNDALDLTGYELAFTIKRSTQDSQSAAICDLRLGTGISFPFFATDGIVDVVIPSLVTSSMRILRPYFWDLTIIDGNDVVSTPFKGTVSVTAPVTNWVSVDS